MKTLQLSIVTKLSYDELVILFMIGFMLIALGICIGVLILLQVQKDNKPLKW